MQRKSKNELIFRSVQEIKRRYLPSLLRSQHIEDVDELMKKTADTTERTLRKRVKK